MAFFDNPLSYFRGPPGQPMIPVLPKVQTNATAVSLRGPQPPPLSSPAQMLAALTEASQAPARNQLLAQQVALAKLNQQLLAQRVGFAQQMFPQINAIMGKLRGGEGGSAGDSTGPAGDQGTTASAPPIPTRLPDAGTMAPGTTPLPDLDQAGYEPPPSVGGMEGGGKVSLAALTSAIWGIESDRRLNPPDSSAGAIGPMQIMPGTGAEYGASIRSLRDPDTNLRVGAAILSDLYKRYDGDPQAIAVAYNAGPGRADKWLASGRDLKTLPPETQRYLAALDRKLNAGTAAPAAGVPAAPAGASAVPLLPQMQQAATNARFKAAAGMPMTPYDIAMLNLGGQAAGFGELGNALAAPYYKTPQYLAQVAAAQEWAKLNPELALKWNAPMATRYGIYGPTKGGYGLLAGYPTLHEVTNPDGSKSYTYLSPPTAVQPVPMVTPTGQGAALSPETEERLRRTGAASVPMPIPGTSLTPGGTIAPAPGAASAFNTMAVARKGPMEVSPTETVINPAAGIVPGIPGAQPAPGSVIRQGITPYQERSQEEQAGEEQKNKQDIINEGEEAQRANAALNNMIQDIAPGGLQSFTPGPWSSMKYKIQSYMRTLPGFGDFNAGPIASYEDYIKNFGMQVRGEVRKLSSRAAVQEYGMVQEALASPTMSPRGLADLLPEFKGLNLYSVAQAQALQQWLAMPQHAQSPDIQKFETQWQQNVTPYTFTTLMMPPARQNELFGILRKTDAGRAQIKELMRQWSYLRSSGLERILAQ